MKDYYKILGVNKNSSKDDIKKAYRKLSKKYHPDVNPQGEKTFKDITEAYETLSNDNKRKEYDNPNPFGNFGDMFSQFNRRRKRNIPPKKIMINVTALDVYFGRNKDITYQVDNGCGTCNGTGGDKTVCGMCGGSGVLQKSFGSGFFRQVNTVSCSGCGGTGQMITNMCFDCSGKGTKTKYENLSIKIPKDIDNGEIINLKGKGDFYVGLGRGNLMVKFNINKEDGFYKEGYNMIYDKILNPIDIALQKPLVIPHPDGDIKINIPNGYITNKPLRVKSKGYQNRGMYGDLYVNLYFNNIGMSDEDTENLLEHINKSSYQDI